MSVPSRERLRQAITSEWEPSGPIAERAQVNRKAAGTMLAAMFQRAPGSTDGTTIERRHNADTGDWEYRRAER
jgi:uncharacterized membrane protein